MAEKHHKKTWKGPQQSHLAQALEGWSHISQSVQIEKPVAPDQKLLNDIKGLLSELKFKLDELSFSPASTPKQSSQNINVVSPTPQEKTPAEKEHVNPLETHSKELD